MGIDPQRDFRIGMPQLIADIGNGFALGQEQAGVGVTQVVETDRAQTSLLESSFKGIAFFRVVIIRRYKLVTLDPLWAVWLPSLHPFFQASLAEPSKGL